MEKYSVLMSLYIKENPDCFRQAVDSMLNQTVPPDQIVIVKDGPLTPELEAVLADYAGSGDNRRDQSRNDTGDSTTFTITGYPENRGLGPALAFGLNECRNQLVARMDTDDISVPDRCEQQLKLFQQDPSLDIAGGDIAEFIGTPENCVSSRQVPAAHEAICEYMKTRCALNHVSVMFRKDAVQRAGGYLDWYWNEDYYLWIRMMLCGCRFANTGTVLVNVRVGAEMYQRRGGRRYFASELGLQNLMLKNHIIGLPTYIMNVGKRLVIQVILPSHIRGWVFRKFARSGAEQ